MTRTAVKPVYALVGGDAFLQLQELRSIVAAVGGDAQRVDVDGERCELTDVLDELRSFAMFGGSKLVVVRNGDDLVTRFRGPLEDYCDSPSDSGTLVLRLESLPGTQRIAKAIARVGEVRKCDPPRDLVGWIMKHAKSAHGLALNLDAGNALADRIGGDLGRIDTELAKLAVMNDGGRVEAGAIVDTVAFQREQELKDMTSALGEGRADEALRRWRQIVATDASAEFRAVTWLGIWLENARKALAMRRKNTPLPAIGQALWIRDRNALDAFVRTTESLGAAGLARAIDLLTQVDRHSKSGVGDAAENVERYILSIAAMLRRPSR